MTSTGLAERSTKRSSDIAAALAARARDGEDGQLVTIEKAPEGLEERVANLAVRLKALEDRPTPLIPSNANEQIVIPQGVMDLADRITNLEERANAGPDIKEDIDELATMIGDIGKAALMQVSALMKRSDALEARMSNLPSEMLVEVVRAQSELKNRRA